MFGKLSKIENSGKAQATESVGRVGLGTQDSSENGTLGFQTWVEDLAFWLLPGAMFASTAFVRPRASGFYL